MNVSAVLVTRGNVPIEPVIESLPLEWEIIEWNNGAGAAYIYAPGERAYGAWRDCQDVSVYGRYAGIELARHDLIYVQDDDVIVSDPQAIVDGLIENYATVVEHPHIHVPDLPVTHVQIKMGTVVCNMPQEFRHEGYTDSALVGFGAAFHRDAPERAFSRFALSSYEAGSFAWGTDGRTTEFFDRTCDVVFTTLTPRVLVDIPKVNREFAEDADRMYRQPDHVGERARMLELARKVRD